VEDVEEVLVVVRSVAGVEKGEERSGQGSQESRDKPEI
jgi:hypothetical protein